MISTIQVCEHAVCQPLLLTIMMRCTFGLEASGFPISEIYGFRNVTIWQDTKCINAEKLTCRDSLFDCTKRKHKVNEKQLPSFSRLHHFHFLSVFVQKRTLNRRRLLANHLTVIDCSLRNDDNMLSLPRVFRLVYNTIINQYRIPFLSRNLWTYGRHII